MKYISVAIDGPSGAGKSTVARAAAAQLGYVYVDTGAMYRTIGLAVCRRGISGEDTEGIRSVLPDIRVGITYENGAQHVLLNGGRFKRDPHAGDRLLCLPRVCRARGARIPAEHPA